MDENKELTNKEKLIVHIKNVREKLDEVLGEDSLKSVQTKKSISPPDSIDDLLNTKKK